METSALIFALCFPVFSLLMLFAESFIYREMQWCFVCPYECLIELLLSIFREFVGTGDGEVDRYSISVLCQTYNCFTFSALFIGSMSRIQEYFGNSAILWVLGAFMSLRMSLLNCECLQMTNSKCNFTVFVKFGGCVLMTFQHSQPFVNASVVFHVKNGCKWRTCTLHIDIKAPSLNAIWDN